MKKMICIVEAQALFDKIERVKCDHVSTASELHELLYQHYHLVHHIDSFQIQVYDAMENTFIALEKYEKKLDRIMRISIQLDSQDKNALPVLAIGWRKFSPNFIAGEFHIQHQSLYIGEIGNAGKGTGLNIWDGSIVLAKFIERHAEQYIQHKRIVEVGAGTGLVGIAATLLGAAQVTVTDLDYTLPNLQKNIALNQGRARSPITALELDWFQAKVHIERLFHTAVSNREDDPGLGLGVDEPPPRIGLVLASDVVWIESLIVPLVQMLATLAQKNRESGKHSGQNDLEILMSYQSRSRNADRLLFSTLDQYQFTVAKVAFDQHHPKFRASNIDIYHIVANNCE